MANKHEKKFFINMLIGLLFTSAGIASIVYSAMTKENRNDWIFWAAIPIVAINAGLLFISSSVVHKVKADFIRRQKQKSSKSDRIED
jgi:uncharacterized membrane protein HdeD (DUF308 family)